MFDAIPLQKTPPITADAVPPEILEQYRRFISYTRSFDSGCPDEDRYLRLKEEHSLQVLALAERIADSEEDFADPFLRRALLLAALFHDIARFLQYTHFHTFSDPRSFDHGAMGNRELGRLAFLADEAPSLRPLIRAAVLLHNRLVLPSALPGNTRRVVLALRDADKLDILRIMHESLRPGVPADPTILLDVEDSQSFTPGVLEACLAGRMALYADLRTTTDFRLLLCSWFYDLNYPSSRRIAACSGIHHALLAALPDHPKLNAWGASFRAALDQAAV